jgi:glycosyltransferase involved in cell wall biosynthesis
MRVLHVIPSVGPLRGGPSFAVRTLTRGLAERGIETHVASTDDNGRFRLDVPLRRPVFENGVMHWYFPRQTPFYLASLPFAAWIWRHAADYDLVHIHSLFSFCPNAAAWAARRKGVPYIIRPLGVLNRWGMSNRRPRLKRLSLNLMEKGLLSGAAWVHYTAEQERLEAAVLGFPHKPLIIPNPVEISAASRTALRGKFRARYPQLEGGRVILFLSRIDRKKGLDLLIPAFRSVVARHPHAMLVIAGDGDRDLIETLQRQVLGCGIADSVLWAGFLSGTDKFEALADADVFVLPSYSENFGIAAVEAMAIGVPVILTDQAGIHREVAERRAGLITPADAVLLADAINTMLSDDRLQCELGRNARLLAGSHFSPEAVINRVIEAYEIALHRSYTFC